MPSPIQTVAQTSRPAVLIVEDEEDLLNEFALALELLGVPVMCASNGPSALDLLAQHPSLCVVLLDWRMVPISGSELMKAINRQFKELRSIGMVALSGAWSDDDLRMAVELGAVACVHKPYLLTTIAKAIKAALTQIGAYPPHVHHPSTPPLPYLDFLDDAPPSELHSAGSTRQQHEPPNQPHSADASSERNR